jgi:hypothetical protein
MLTLEEIDVPNLKLASQSMRNREHRNAIG